MKKIICYLLLSAMLLNGFALNSNASKIYGAEPCSDCTAEPSNVTNEWLDKNGNEVKMYEENDFNVINTVASNLTPLLSKKDSDFIDALTKLSSHKNDMLFKAFQYITLAEIKDT